LQSLQPQSAVCTLQGTIRIHCNIIQRPIVQYGRQTVCEFLSCPGWFIHLTADDSSYETGLNVGLLDATLSPSARTLSNWFECLKSTWPPLLQYVLECFIVSLWWWWCGCIEETLTGSGGNESLGDENVIEPGTSINTIAVLLPVGWVVLAAICMAEDKSNKSNTGCCTIGVWLIVIKGSFELKSSQSRLSRSRFVSDAVSLSRYSETSIVPRSCGTGLKWETSAFGVKNWIWEVSALKNEALTTSVNTRALSLSGSSNPSLSFTSFKPLVLLANSDEVWPSWITLLLFEWWSRRYAAPPVGRLPQKFRSSLWGTLTVVLLSSEVDR